MNNMTTAVSLALLLARDTPSPEVMEEASGIISQGFNADEFLAFGRRHGLAPIIYHNASHLKGFPAEVLGKLKESFLWNTGDVLRTAAELDTILAELRDNGAEAVPLKGFVNAAELFDGLPLYPSADIDLLVRKGDSEKALSAVKQMGYEPVLVGADPAVNPYQEVAFTRKGSKMVELHFGLGNLRYFIIPEEYWWEGLRAVEWDGRTYRVLSVEKNILYSSIHLFCHGYSPLKFVALLAAFLKKYNNHLSWDMLFGDAKRFGVCKPLLLALSLAAGLFGAPLCPLAEGHLKGLSRKERWIFKKIRTDIFRRQVHYARTMFLLTLLLSGWGEVAGKMVRWVFPPLREVSLRYGVREGSAKTYLYYILNPALLLLRRR